MLCVACLLCPGGDVLYVQLCRVLQQQVHAAGRSSARRHVRETLEGRAGEQGQEGVEGCVNVGCFAL